MNAMLEAATMAVIEAIGCGCSSPSHELVPCDNPQLRTPSLDCECRQAARNVMAAMATMTPVPTIQGLKVDYMGGRPQDLWKAFMEAALRSEEVV